MERLADELPVEQVAKRWIVASDPGKALAQIKPYVDAGLNHLVFHGPGDDQERFLTLHWADVRLDEAVLFVRYTLSNGRNTTPIMTSPKTKSSHAWVGLSNRVNAALNRQAHHQEVPGVTSDLVFSQPNGVPLRPGSVLHHFHRLCADAGVPRVLAHDLRHLAATLMISSQVPPAMASKTLGHSKLSITVATYGHLVPYAAQQAADAIADALAAAEQCTSDA